MVKLLDVSIRDGGFSNQWNFTKQEVVQGLQCASDTGIDYFEIGYLMNKELSLPGDGMYRNVSFDCINEIVREVRPTCKISVLIDYWRYNIENLLPPCETSIDLIRVTCYMDRAQEAIDYLIKVKALGYSVSLNVMCGSYLTSDIIISLKQTVMEYSDLLDYFYIADSFGSMTPNDVVYVFSQLQDVGVPLGFHIHNNCEIGMANMIASLDYVDIVDASYNSMGRGAGNVALEYVMMYLVIKTGNSVINLEPMMNFMQDKGDDTIVDRMTNALVGLLNVHPYKIRGYPHLTMYELYTKLYGLTPEQKIKY
jgi:4-hydroxy 2-oxovalerate aldolase